MEAGIKAEYKKNEGTVYVDGYKNLTFYIIQVAVEDYLFDPKKHPGMSLDKIQRAEIDKETARYFFKSDWFKFLCESLGMSGDYILRNIRKKMGEDK